MYFGLAEILIIFLSLTLIVTIKLINKNPPAIFNIYQRPNGYYWLKVGLMLSILNLRRFFNRFRPKPLIEALERPQQLSTDPKAIDAVYFNGANKSGDHLVVGTARRHDKLIDGFFYLLIDESKLGLLESPKLPGTSLYQPAELAEYKAEGIEIEPIEAMNKWRVAYTGKMKQAANRGNEVDVEIRLEWGATTPFFNFDTDMNACAVAKATALEQFSRQYFDNLKSEHQTHYEQFGELEGEVKIEGRSYKLSLNTVRDHSFGLKREWRAFHRYALHFFSTENGDRFHVGVICWPICFSRLPIGYVYRAKENKMFAISSCDLELYQHGEGGDPPLDYAFTIIDSTNRSYTVQINVKHSPHFYISKDWESKVIEALCTVDVNGVKGWGAAEWQYRNVKGKNV